MAKPSELLDHLLAKAKSLGSESEIQNPQVLGRVDYVCRCLRNRAGVRLLMSCMLAKLDRPEVDPRKPYTQIGGADCFSGRTYDEQYLTHFINTNRLPCNPTTAFLTPALRNHNSSLVATAVLVGRPPRVYSDTLQLLDDVANGTVSAEHVLIEVIRVLLLVRNEKQARMADLVAALRHEDGALPLSSEAIVTLLEQHILCKHSSRLPVLIVAAAYDAIADRLGERPLPLRGHLAADEQTGAMGDIEVCLVNEDRVVTIYEMKSKRVMQDDIDRALQKIVSQVHKIDNYVFITTDVIEPTVSEYSAGMYEQTNGIEIVVLDCIGFVRHFLHLFHRSRIRFLDEYQALVLAEADSAVSQPLKEAFLTLRQSAESDE